MPKTPIDYQKGIIYKIQHIEKLELFYVGSTTNFNKRKQEHKSNCNNINSKQFNQLVYKMIRDNSGWESFKMIIIKEYPCNSKIELLIEEDRLMMELKSNMNAFRAFRGQKQYNLDNKEHIKLQKKQYNLDNKELISEQQKQYRLDNKDSIKEYKSIKYTCECGSNICNTNKATHLRSLKHQNYLKIQ